MESIENLPLPISPQPSLVPPSPSSRSKKKLPTMYDLPSEDPEEPGLPDEFHFLQPLLLMLGFVPVGWSSDRVFSAGDMNLYYDSGNTLRYKRPDWMGAVGVPRLYEGKDLRLSYVTWQEEANPFVIVELLSPGTEEEDLGKTTSDRVPTKWQVYEQILKIPYYFIFSRYTNQLRGFRLNEEGVYKKMRLSGGRLRVPELGLSLGVWQGEFRGQRRLWLRWLTLAGDLIPIPEEEAESAREEAKSAREEAESAREEAEYAREEAEFVRKREEAARKEAESAREEAESARKREEAAREEAESAREEAESAQRRVEELAARLRELGIDADEV